MQGIQNVYPEEIDRYVGDSSAIIIDLRTKNEYDEGHINGAVNMSVESIESNIYLIPKNKTIIVYCGRGGRSIMAARILSKYGYQVKNVIGGIKNYRGSSLTEKKSRFNI